MNNLEGETAPITAGNSGIGLATAMQFVNEGAYVFITWRHHRAGSIHEQRARRELLTFHSTGETEKGRTL